METTYFNHFDLLLNSLTAVVDSYEDEKLKWIIDPPYNTGTNSFCSLNILLLKIIEKTGKTITETAIHLTNLLKYYLYLAIDGFIRVFDLSNYDPIFSFDDPPELHRLHLSEALKEIHKNNGENIEKYRYLCFKIEDIKRMIDTLQENIPKHREKQESENLTIETEHTSEEIKDLIQTVKRSNLKTKEQNEIIKAIRTNKREWNNACSLIYSFLFVYGGEDVANNPRRYFEESKGEITANYKKSGENKILIDFQLKGLAFPVSGRTLEKYKPQHKITPSKN